jgi:Werner syndrome ATP-dependent helicase
MGVYEREQVHKKFSKNDISCVVATIAFGMGIDITIRKVIHYGIPKDMESYYQEIGRAGRDGLESHGIMFYAMADMNTNNYFIMQTEDISYRKHLIQLATVMKKYVFSSECRRKYILEYFNEKYEHNNCKSCDNCLRETQVNMHNFAFEGYLMFKVLNLTGNKYGGCMLVDILRGSEAKKISPLYKKSDVHGKGKNHSDKWWKMFLSLLVNNKYILEIAITGSRAFSLAISDSGKKWLNQYVDDEKVTLILPVPSEMPEMDHPTKKNSIHTTLEMLVLGKTINEISIETKLTTQTIENHICELYDGDFIDDLEIFGFTNKIYDLIITKSSGLGESATLKDIKNALPKYISYLGIRLALIKQKKDAHEIDI